ncbi:HTTM domain-containing protein [Streptomyces sp. Ag109_G2-6]|uniref:HTTM domain-containing protein n=1 Tax=Streptomyces sp. Ag109_G2-6 TaxID=2485154 RepID=UPI000F4E8EBA|nr:HTTM domain-containing protein [Streptomyces sp. Ag109_G2-6]
MRRAVAKPVAEAVAKVSGKALGPHQSAVVRIGFAGTWLFFLLREFPHRHELYGPDGPWSWQLAERLVAGNHAFTVLLWSASGWWFELVYGLAVAASALLALGWRTRAMSVLFMVGVLSLQNRSVFMGDGGDNVVHLMAVYLVLTRCARVWSLDARRARLRGSAAAGAAGPVLWGVLGAVLAYGAVSGRLSGGWTAVFAALWVGSALWWLVERYEPEGERRAALDVLANLLHNAGMLVIMAEVCLIYATAGWYKIQGSRWQDGTALYYPLRLDYFSPWPGLSGVLAGSGVVVMLLTYGTVAVQVAFPFTLFNRRVKNVLLAGMMLEHAGIAVLLGLPFFSLAMIAADAVFLPTGLLVWVGARVAALRVALPLRGASPRPALSPFLPQLPLGAPPGASPGPLLGAPLPDPPPATTGGAPSASNAGEAG